MSIFKKRTLIDHRGNSWVMPEYSSNPLCADILTQPHLLIAGATGSGKSVVLNAVIVELLRHSPDEMGLVLIDPKRVELNLYRKTPHCMGYASEPDDIRSTLEAVIEMMENRYQKMQDMEWKRYPGKKVFVVIDELADLLTTDKKRIQPILCRIAQLGRAAEIHMFAATQRPTRDIINGQITVNVDSRIALRCPTAQDSRNIIRRNGAELLPRYGKGLYLTPETMVPVEKDMPFVDDDTIKGIVRFWAEQAKNR